MTTQTISQMDAASVELLRKSYRSLVRYGQGSVRSSWRFGQTIDSLSDAYTRPQIAEAVGVSTSTIYRYTRLFFAYQRPELAVEASERLETFNIDIISEMAGQLGPVEHGRPMAGRRFRYRCTGCGGHDIKREEITDDDEPPAEPEQLAGTVPQAKWSGLN